MMTPPPLPNLFGRATAIFDEHKTLHKTVAQLHDLCSGLSLGRRDVESELTQVIDLFTRQLREHFSSEEADGYFDTLASSSAEASELVAALHVEHTDMLECLDELSSLMARPASAGELAECLRQLLDQFEAHETKESHAMQQFLCSDAPH